MVLTSTLELLYPVYSLNHNVYAFLLIALLTPMKWLAKNPNSDKLDFNLKFFLVKCVFSWHTLINNSSICVAMAIYLHSYIAIILIVSLSKTVRSRGDRGILGKRNGWRLWHFVITKITMTETPKVDFKMSMDLK